MEEQKLIAQDVTEEIQGRQGTYAARGNAFENARVTLENAREMHREVHKEDEELDEATSRQRTVFKDAARGQAVKTKCKST